MKRGPCNYFRILNLSNKHTENYGNCRFFLSYQHDVMEIMLGKTSCRSWSMLLSFFSFLSSIPSFRRFAGKKLYYKINFPNEFFSMYVLLLLFGKVYVLLHLRSPVCCTVRQVVSHFCFSFSIRSRKIMLLLILSDGKEIRIDI